MQYFQDIDAYIERIKNYKGTNTLFVNVQSLASFIKVMDELQVFSFKIQGIANLSKNDDEIVSLDTLLNSVKYFTENTVLIGVDWCTKLQGEEISKKWLQQLCTISHAHRLVVLLYQCQQQLNMLSKNDIRKASFIYTLNEKTDKQPSIVFIREPLASYSQYAGLKYMLDALERITFNDNVLYVATQKTKSNFPNSNIQISEIKSAYQILCTKYPELKNNTTEKLGCEKQWEHLLSILQKNDSLDAAFTKTLGCNKTSYDIRFSKWNEWDTMTQWIYFLALKCSKEYYNNEYLKIAISNAQSFEDFENCLYHCILNFTPVNKQYKVYYSQRKELISVLANKLDIVKGFCSIATTKGDNEIFYLTDQTELERNHIITCLATYSYNKKILDEVLKMIYPALSQYMSNFHFGKPLLDNYFQTYKYQKLTNRVFEEFLVLVQIHAKEREFNSVLPYRSEIIDKIKKENTWLYFLDAMGVEYLGFIMQKCKENGLQAKVTICHANLPTITSVNREFYEEWNSQMSSNIKKLDEIKHSGEDDFNYQKTILPIHLCKELEIIEKVIKNAKAKLANNQCKKVVIASDHGSSRLAVIHDKSKNFDANSKGEHGGRCCKYSDEIEHIPLAIEENGYYVIANYDRFKGGRKASVETHGGATLEEVVIPVIELTEYPTNIEVRIINDPIKVSFKTKAEIELYSNTLLIQPVLNINGKIYRGHLFKEYIYIFSLDDLKKAGKYTATLFSDNNLIKEDLIFNIENEGLKGRELL